MSEQPPEYTPFTTDCPKCEYEPVCFVPLRIVNKITHKWFLSMGRAPVCRQGRKRKVIRQSTIAEIVAKCQEKHKAPEVI
jgi:hypothetical protein